MVLILPNNVFRFVLSFFLMVNWTIKDGWKQELSWSIQNNIYQHYIECWKRRDLQKQQQIAQKHLWSYTYNVFSFFSFNFISMIMMIIIIVMNSVFYFFFSSVITSIHPLFGFTRSTFQIYIWFFFVDDDDDDENFNCS